MLSSCDQENNQLISATHGFKFMALDGNVKYRYLRINADTDTVEEESSLFNSKKGSQKKETGGQKSTTGGQEVESDARTEKLGEKNKVVRNNHQIDWPHYRKTEYYTQKVVGNINDQSFCDTKVYREIKKTELSPV